MIAIGLVLDIVGVRRGLLASAASKGRRFLCYLPDVDIDLEP
jgi:hypothetical protein